jgi:glyoxylase-like metal-dependent hydrolase (beta-lactamase superfamily II)
VATEGWSARCASTASSRTDITDVILTHLHADHLCGTMQNGQPTFPNATYRCHIKDWAFFATAQSPVSFAKGRPPGDRLANMIGRLEPWDGEAEILPGIHALPTPGHTPGSTVIVLHSGPERAFMLGDVAHCVVELLEPEWDGLADFDTELAKRTREALARELEGTTRLRSRAGTFPACGSAASCSTPTSVDPSVTPADAPPATTTTRHSVSSVDVD